jgi:hypothetical protein
VDVPDELGTVPAGERDGRVRHTRACERRHAVNRRVDDACSYA